jgi:hypothetical protein
VQDAADLHIIVHDQNPEFHGRDPSFAEKPNILPV